MTGRSRDPRAFAVEAPPRPDAASGRERAPRAIDDPARIEMAQEDVFERESGEAQTTTPPGRARRGGIGPGAVAATALGVIVALALGIWFEQLVGALFERHRVLGRIGLGAIAVLALAAAVAIGREVVAIGRQSVVDRVREEIAAALDGSNARAMTAATERLAGHYARHPKTAAGRARLAELEADIIDPEDRYRITERELLSVLDAEARALVVNAARRVSVVTAVSPRALVDIGYVLFENVRLIRAIAAHYGGRAGALGTLTLVRRVVGHLVVTGTVAVGDSLIQQLVGQGVAARLSARLGEGVVNGLMTARVGIAAMTVSRPAPFIALPRPTLTEIARALGRHSAAAGDDANPDAKDSAR